uniref:FAD-binding domain-containing protein n=1 Tax=Quercus lobata TaxID=97700 RepID=A0A7N2LQV9_QUELO
MNNNRRIIRVAQAEDVFSSWILPYMCTKLQRNQNPKEQTASDGSAVAKDPELIQQLTLDSINGFPTEMVEMVKNSDLESLSIARLRYRAPWDVLRGSFRKGTVAVVGDAMHVMDPFLGQGGSAAIEDAIVLARCFARKMHGDGGQVIEHKVGEAVDEYVKERRMRLVWLSTQTYLVGLLVKKSPWLVRFACNILMMVLLRLICSY